MNARDDAPSRSSKAQGRLRSRRRSGGRTSSTQPEIFSESALVIPEPPLVIQPVEGRGPGIKFTHFKTTDPLTEAHLKIRGQRKSAIETRNQGRTKQQSRRSKARGTSTGREDTQVKPYRDKKRKIRSITLPGTGRSIGAKLQSYLRKFELLQRSTKPIPFSLEIKQAQVEQERQAQVEQERRDEIVAVAELAVIANEKTGNVLPRYFYNLAGVEPPDWATDEYQSKPSWRERLQKSKERKQLQRRKNKR